MKETLSHAHVVGILPVYAIPIAISWVNQVDAGRLDIEMPAMLKEQMVKVFSVMKRSLARRLWFIVQRVEGFYKAASFASLLVFLYTGRYRNLIERAI
ncbi:unnamed protein product [Lactuca saligna]|uniref:Uncharacterized protein n=1 Tax=Lactuca saligna TaxID=75948 RepID=A0AA35ZDE4_LACSI|nr:unnamed protein product [Lactuca saligna]